MRKWFVFGACMLVAYAAYAGFPNSSGRCVSGQSCDFGTTATTLFNFVTDGTGDAEVVFPVGAIGTADILDGTVSGTDIGASAVASADIFDGTIAAGDMSATFVFTSTANDMGWTINSGADTACTTTCTSACIVGFDNGAADAEALVSCASATADVCLCAGAS
jgi:hypothetical protein